MYHMNANAVIKDSNYLTGESELESVHVFQNIAAASMGAGVRRAVCVTALSSRHWETAARSVSDTHIGH